MVAEVSNVMAFTKNYDLAQEHDYNVIELSGVEPNPRIETVRKGIALCHENQVDVILPVGGGSTIDCAKAIGAGFYSRGDPWRVIAARKGYTGNAITISNNFNTCSNR